MAGYLAYHRTRLYAGIVADLYGNDPFVWVTPFVWSHCHARDRPRWFGDQPRGACVHGQDVMFFAGHHPATGELVCDSVLVFDGRTPIEEAEAQWPGTHPIRHFHFDQDWDPAHEDSQLTWMANPQHSFVSHPAMPVGAWIQEYVTETQTTIHAYFGQPRRKKARKLANPQGLYDRAVAWTQLPGHQRLPQIPLATLQALPPRNRTDLPPIQW